MGAVAGTIALIAIPSLIFGFWPQIRRAFQEPASGGGSVGAGTQGRRAAPGERPIPDGRRLNRSKSMEKITFWDPERYSRGQNAFAFFGMWLVGPFAWLVYGCRPEGRDVSEWVPICPECYERFGHLSDCSRGVPPGPQPSPQPGRCGSCGAAEGEHHDPDRCTDHEALLRQAISLTKQLIQMKQDEIFVKTGRGRDDL
jgi:hypothetical protein